MQTKAPGKCIKLIPKIITDGEFAEGHTYKAGACRLTVEFLRLERPVIQLDPADILKGIQLISIDCITGKRVSFRVTTISTNDKDACTVFVVVPYHGRLEDGLFFITRTLAECYITNITGKPDEQDVETGGRTLKELIDYLDR